MLILKKLNNIYSFEGSLQEKNAIRNILTFEDEKLKHVKAIRGTARFSFKKKFYSTQTNTYRIGLHKRVCEGLKQNNIAYKIIDRSVYKFPSTFKIVPNLRDYQNEAASAFLQEKVGIIKVATRGGKTYIAAELIKQIITTHPQAKILFLVENSDLFVQTFKHFKNEFEEIGRIKERLFDIKSITVASMQTVTRRYYSKAFSTKKQTHNYLKTIDFLIVDEMHEYCSEKRRRILRYAANQSELILGLSATPFDEYEIDNIRLEEIFGPVIYTIEEQSLVEKKALAESKTLMLWLPQKLDDLYSYQAMYEYYIVHSKIRNQIIADLVTFAKTIDLKTLVFFARQEHGQILASRTQDPVIDFTDDSDYRQSVKEYFLSGKGKALYVSNIWKKGITLPEVQLVINAGGGKKKSAAIQKRGRILGTTEEKSRACTIDFLDDFKSDIIETSLNFCYLDEHALSRLRAYESLTGSENIVYFDTEQVNFQQDIQSYLMNWFNGK